MLTFKNNHDKQENSKAIKLVLMIKYPGLLYAATIDFTLLNMDQKRGKLLI
jgi:hypothetical protein